MVPLIMMGVGTAMQIGAGIRKNIEQAAQEMENSKWLAEQAKFARESMFRELRRTEQEYSTKVGQQVGAYAASGVDLSGSAALTVAGTYAGAYEELAAVRRKGEMDIALASSRSRLAERNAAGLSDPGANFMQAAGTAVNAYSSTGGFGMGFGGGSSGTAGGSAGMSLGPAQSPGTNYSLIA